MLLCKEQLLIQLVRLHRGRMLYTMIPTLCAAICSLRSKQLWNGIENRPLLRATLGLLQRVAVRLYFCPVGY